MGSKRAPVLSSDAIPTQVTPATYDAYGWIAVGSVSTEVANQFVAFLVWSPNRQSAISQVHRVRR
ncbi:hypothetical protein A8144_07260 [Mycobacterium leprae 3125609]|nr:hypothetical protein A8144_07260 [Mycobacterium leprae 3125609]OAX71369.1 hypothetical protein A3216_06240 [Mycobacterium leprae 7935681]